MTRGSPLWFCIAVLMGSNQSFAQSADSSLSVLLKGNAHVIESCELTAPLKDLLFLKKLFEGKRIISMGEATHGTREFAQLKGRFFKYLVEELDFNIIALEADFGEALAVNEYVLGTHDDGLGALMRLKFFHCVNEETLQLINWMRLYNRNRAFQMKVKFYGFDFQMADGQLTQIEQYLSRVDTAFARQVRELRPMPASGYYGPSLDIKDIVLIRETIQHDSAKYVIKSGVKEWETALHLTYTLEDFYHLRKTPEKGFSRDMCMKKNIDWILKHEGSQSKILLWAHNEHVIYDSVSNQETGYFKRMGLALKETYGKNLYTIAFDFNKGKFYANKPLDSGGRMLTVYEMSDAHNGTLASVLSKIPFDTFFIDIQNASEDGRVRSWLHNPIVMRSIGGMVPEECIVEQSSCSFIRVSLLTAYDGVIFVHQTHEINLLKK